MSAEIDIFQADLGSMDPRLTLLQQSLTTGYPYLFTDFLDENTGVTDQGQERSDTHHPIPDPTITENNPNVTNKTSINNLFTIGYHVNDLGEIDELVDHNGVGVEAFVSNGYWFLGWIFLHAEWCYPFFTSYSDLMPTALECLKRFGYANLPSSQMIPLFCQPDLLPSIRQNLRSDEIRSHVSSVGNHHGALIFEISSQFSRIMNFYVSAVFNPVDPVTGVEAGAGKKHGKKRQRSISTSGDFASSSSKRIASSAENEDYKLTWLTASGLNNIHALAVWAKYRFRFVIITTILPDIAPTPYLTPQGRAFLAAECYKLSQTTLNMVPETRYNLNGTPTDVEEIKVIALIAEEHNTFHGTCMRRFTEKFLPSNFLDDFCTASSDRERKDTALKLLAKIGTSENDDLLALTDETDTHVVCPFGSSMVCGALNLICFQKLSREKTSLAGMFKGILGPNKAVPDETLAFACSVICDSFAIKFFGKKYVSHGHKYNFLLEKIKVQRRGEYGSVMLAEHKSWNK